MARRMFSISTRSLPMVAGAAVLLGTAAPSLAQYVWSGGGGDRRWSTSANWTVLGVPLPNGLYPSGLLATASIPGGYKVELDVSVTMAQVTIETLSCLHVSAGKTIADASFAGDGTLDNCGSVKAALRTVQFGPSLALADTPGFNRWVASGLTATLKFNRAFTGESALSGDFAVSIGGTLNFQASVTTAGDYNGTNASVITAPGVTFIYSGGQCP